jgi:intracellular sulfur oxidation DsrE/DsrF family protein
MRFIVILGVLLLFPLTALEAQKTEGGPIVADFGSVYAVPEADLNLSPEKTYRVLFDVYTDPAGKDDMNPLLTTVARFMNMHGQNGISREDMKIVVVLHGAGVKNVLNDEVHREEFKRANPNGVLLKELHEAGVRLFVCGQSLSHRGYGKQDLAEPVEVSLSAMTALVHYQEEGYRIINFN